MSTVVIVLITIVLFAMFLLFIGVVSRAIRNPSMPGPPLTSDEEGHYFIAEKSITCNQCGGTQFAEHETLLNTWLLSLVTLDWLDPSVTALICRNCGQLTWFAQKPNEPE